MPIPSEVETVRRPLLREEVFERLQDWILAGALLPGEQLRDTDLSVRLGVSRTPIREALRMLEDQGLVETAAGRWTRVSRISVREAQELFPVICALETHLIEGVIAQLTGERVAAMMATNEAWIDALRKGELGLAAQADAAFHQLFRQTADNLTVVGLLEGLGKKASRFLNYVPHRASDAYGLTGEHEAIIAALAAARAAEAGRAVSAHWRQNLSRLERRWSEASGHA